METQFLQTFVLVADSGSMSEASRRLGLTPAAVAQQIRALERELGGALLARAGRTVAPTEAGHRLLARARPLLREVADLRAVVGEAQAVGELRLGTINTALHSLLPELLARFVERQPGVKVFIRSDASVRLVQAVREGELDAAVCLHPAFALPKAFAWALLREEPLVVLAPEHLAGQDPHRLLREQPLIRYDRQVGGGQQADRYLRQAGITPTERFELSSLLAIAMMVDQGLGVSLVPDIASPLSQGLAVRRLPLPLVSEPRRFGVLWRRDNPRQGLIRGFLDGVARPAPGAAPRLAPGGRA